MRNVRYFAAMVAMTSLMLAAPGFLRAAEPEALAQKVFDVRIEGGVVDVAFALALSEVASYPVTISAISGAVEELLWDGMLSEGFYRLRAPLTKITSGTLKVVVRTRITNRTAQGPQSYTRYLTWEGAITR